MTHIRFGIAGYGLMGELYADALEKYVDTEVTAITTTNSEKSSFAQDKYGCQTYATFEEMYQSSHLDAVIIALPDHLHRDAVIKAAQSKLHMLIEKPFATSLSDAEAMLQAINESGVHCMVEFFNRWSAPFSKAKEIVDSGQLGEIVCFSAVLNDSISVPTEMLKWASKTSPAWFLMSHTADLAQWITGKKPVKVFAKGLKQVLESRGIDTFDYIEAIVEYEDQTIGHFTHNWILPKGIPLIYELKMRFVGTDSAIDIDTSDQELHLITQTQVTHPQTAWGNISGQLAGHPYLMLRSFIDSIIENKKSLVGPEDGLENTRLLDAVHRSIETKTEIIL